MNYYEHLGLYWFHRLFPVLIHIFHRLCRRSLESSHFTCSLSTAFGPEPKDCPKEHALLRPKSIESSRNYLHISGLLSRRESLFVNRHLAFLVVRSQEFFFATFTSQKEHLMTAWVLIVIQTIRQGPGVSWCDSRIRMCLRNPTWNFNIILREPERSWDPALIGVYDTSM